MPETICPFCRRAYPPDFKWCMDDGSELEQNIGQYEETVDEIQKIPCPDCGEMIDPRDVFCGACGAKLEGRIPKYIEPEAPEPEYESPGEYAGGAAETAAIVRNCPGCGAGMTLADTFCGECGAKVEAVTPGYEPGVSERACANCAGGLEPGDTFCGVCGHPVQPEGSAAPAGVSVAAGAGACPNCGMEVIPGDAFCGTCGQPMSASVSQPAAASFAAAGPASSACPNCGADVATGDVFCGTCGNPMGEAAPAAAPSAFAPPPPAPPAPAVDPAMLTVCPSCSLEVIPGDVFCGSCGYNLAEHAAPPPDLGGPDEEFAPEPEPEPLVIVDPFGGKRAKPMDITCPKCGLQNQHDAAVCSACGHVFAEEQPAVLAGVSCPNCGSPMESGDAFCGTCGNTLGSAPAEPVVAFDIPQTDLPPVKRSIADARADALICPMCGVEAMPGEVVCNACGTPLTTSAILDSGPETLVGFDAPEEPVQEPAFESAPIFTEPVAAPAAPALEPVAVPAAAPPKPEAAAGAGKLCSCCGNDCPADADFCPNCGVDFE